MRSLLISVLFLSITLICIFSVNKIEFGYQLEDYFTAGSSDFETYQNHKSTFGEDNNFLMIGFESRENAFQLEFLNPIKKIGENIEKIDGVKQVINPTTLKRMIRLPFLGFKSENILSLDSQEDLDKSQKRIHSNKTILHSQFSRDSSSILMYLILEDTVKKNDGEKILTNIKKTIDSAPLIDGTMVYYAGQINTQAYYRNALQNEVVFFGILTIILLLGFLYLAYRSVYLAVYALVCLSIAFIISGSITIAFLGELDFLMTLLPSIIFTIGISTIIHLIDDYKVYGLQPAIGQNLELNRALKKTKKITFICSLTSAIGFFSLVFLEISPLQNFGIFSALGIMITWTVCFYLFPALVSLFAPNVSLKSNQSAWKKNLSNLFALIVLKKKAVLILTILFVSIAVIGITRIEINSHFLDDLNDTSKLKNELKFFEEKFGGIRPFEMNVTCKKDISTTDLHVINQLDSAQSYLEKEYGLSLAISVITLLKETNVTLNAGNFDHYKIPQEQEKFTSLLNFVHTKSLFEKSSYFINGNQFRFSGKIKDLGSKEIRQKNDELLRYLAQFDEYLHFEITGAAHLMDEANNNVSLYLISGLFFSILIVTVIIAITLKSIKFALISILPNILPLILVMGLMGWIGIDLKISTALIFTVLYGIAVDDTIHLLLGYQTERKRKRMDALEFTYTSTGKKIILTSIMICAGFLAFLFSEFTSTVYAGFLLIIGLGITLMADLINLPIILSSLENKHK